MPTERLLTIRLPDALYSAALRAAATRSITPAEVVRITLAERLGTDNTDPSLDLELRQALGRDIAESADWLDLQRRLRARNLVLRRRDGALWLHSWPIEQALSPLDCLGADEGRLGLHYRAAFPAYGDEPRRAWGRRMAGLLTFRRHRSRTRGG